MPTEKVQEFASGKEAMVALIALAKKGGLPVPTEASEVAGLLAPFLIGCKVAGAPGSFDLHKALSAYNDGKPVLPFFTFYPRAFLLPRRDAPHGRRGRV